MAKKSKLATPDWILQEKTKPLAKKKSGNSFKIRECPKCHSHDVQVILTGEEGRGTGEWECRKCKWTGKNVVEKQLSEEEFMKYLDEKGEEVA